ncbi:UNVERIFIED_CONTAM: hypothetical protein Slati_2164700 [Sesamum latifolium]|uniref:Retrotransposon gag domain-containing protein n=1 Tax=Sesamum latifolium TaxID=2727402 RepID=A0AAW2WWE6_9LAMI
MRLPKNPSHLFAIIQEEGESLKSYIQKFSNEVLDIPNMNPEFISGIVAQGLRSRGLVDSLIGEPGTSWEELMTRAEKFILIEESRKIKSSYRARREPVRENTRKTQEWKKDDHRRKAEFYTPLKTTRAEALATIESGGIVRWPSKMKGNEGKQKSSKYCQFHRDGGHTTEECFHLKEELERLIQSGYLQELIRSREKNIRVWKNGKLHEGPTRHGPRTFPKG